MSCGICAIRIPKTRLSAVKLLRDAKYPEAIAPIAPLVNDPIDDIQLEAIATELSFFIGEEVKARRMIGFVVERRNPAVAATAFDLGPTAVSPRPVPPELVSGADPGDRRRQRARAARSHVRARRGREAATDGRSGSRPRQGTRSLRPGSPNGGGARHRAPARHAGRRRVAEGDQRFARRRAVRGDARARRPARGPRRAAH